MPPRILVRTETEPQALVLMDLSDSTPEEKRIIAGFLGLKTMNSRHSKVPLALLRPDGAAFITNQGRRIFPELQSPVAAKTLETLAAAWLAEISGSSASAPAESPDSPA